jgi:hypothetical protein
VAKVGLAEAAVLLKQNQAYGDPRFLALNRLSEKIAQSAQPLVPERLVVFGDGQNGDGASAVSLFGKLIALLLAEKAGAGTSLDAGPVKDLEDFAKEFSEKPGKGDRSRAGGKRG